MSMVFCRGCAKEIHSTALACPGCGAPQGAVQAQAATVSTGTGFFDVLKKYATFSGRARRKEFWMFILVCTVIQSVLLGIDRLIGTGDILSTLFNVAVLIPTWAVSARRLHDTNHSGWWILVPIVNLVFWCQDSHPGTNRFGSNPKGII